MPNSVRVQSTFAPLGVITLALLLCTLNSAATHPELSITSPDKIYQQLFIGQILSLPLFLLPILLEAIFGNRRRLIQWFHWGTPLPFRAFTGLFIALLLAIHALTAILAPTEVQPMVSLLTSIPWHQKAVIGGFLVISTPLLEEFLFRGILLHAAPPKIMLPLSALLFALAHGINAFLAPLFFFGWFLGLLALRQHSLLPGILLHAALNLLTLLTL